MATADGVATTGKPDLKDIVVEIRGVSWYFLGLQLNVPPVELGSIERDYLTTDRKQAATIEFWLNNDCDASWDKLVSALTRMGGNTVLAESLRRKYVTKESISDRLPCVKRYTFEMKEKFSRLVEEVYMKFSKLQVSFVLLKLYVVTFRTSSDGRDHELLPREASRQLRKAKSLEDIFHTLSEYWDFQNYHLLQFIVNRYGDAILKQAISEYQEDLGIYQRNVKLLEYVQALPEGTTGKGFDGCKLTIEIPGSATEASLSCVEEFQVKFTNAFGIPVHVIRLDKAEESSILLTWLVPESLLPIFLAATAQENYIALSVLQLQVTTTIKVDYRSNKPIYSSTAFSPVKSPQKNLPHALSADIISPTQGTEMIFPGGMSFKELQTDSGHIDNNYSPVNTVNAMILRRRSNPDIENAILEEWGDSAQHPV